MSYSRYFGMRSFENVVRAARFRAPAAQPASGPIRIGSPVRVDEANNGRFVQATGASAPDALCGIAVFEHIQNKSDELTLSYDEPYDRVPLNQYAQLMRGPGVKVWFKNMPAKTMYDGRVRSAAGLLEGVTANANGTFTGLPAIGDGLRPGANGGWAATGAGEDAWLIVENVNPNTGVVEARLTF